MAKKEVVKESVESTVNQNTATEEATTVNELVEKNMDQKYKDTDNTGKLFLRMFTRNPEKGNKTVTYLKGKVYFPKNPDIDQGWYIASIIKEADRYGVMDTIPLKDIPVAMWDPSIIKGIFLKKDYMKSQLHVYRAIPKERLQNEESQPIFIVDAPELFNNEGYDNSNSIANILKAKLKEGTSNEGGEK